VFFFFAGCEKTPWFLKSKQKKRDDWGAPSPGARGEVVSEEEEIIVFTSSNHSLFFLLFFVS
jgi:hypothetical protein